MTDFETSGSVTIEIDQRSLREARQSVENEIGSVTVQARADGGRRGAGRRAGGGTSTSGLVGGAGVIEELGDQTELLDDILEEIEKAGVSGGGGGGGGDGGGLGTLGTLGLGSMLGGGGGGILGGALGGAATRALPSTAMGGTMAGLGLGLGGVEGMRRMGAFGGIESAGQDVGQRMPDRVRHGMNFVPGNSVAAAIPGFAQATAGMDPEGGVNRMQSDVGQLWQQRRESAGWAVGQGQDAGEAAWNFATGDDNNSGENALRRQDGIHSRGGLQAPGTEMVDRRNQQDSRPDPKRAAEQKLERVSDSTRLGGHTAPTGGQTPPPGAMQQQAAENRSRARKTRRPGEGAQAPQVTNNITIEAGSMRELQREIERKIQEVVNDFGEDLTGGVGFP